MLTKIFEMITLTLLRTLFQGGLVLNPSELSTMQQYFFKARANEVTHSSHISIIFLKNKNTCILFPISIQFIKFQLLIRHWCNCLEPCKWQAIKQIRQVREQFSKDKRANWQVPIIHRVNLPTPTTPLRNIQKIHDQTAKCVQNKLLNN